MVEFSDDAISDLMGIRETIAEYNPDLATEKAASIIEVCQLLDSQPGMGGELSGVLRRFSKRPWVIVYRPADAGGVYIHRIFDSRQDWRSQLV